MQLSIWGDGLSDGVSLSRRCISVSHAPSAGYLYSRRPQPNVGCMRAMLKMSLPLREERSERCIQAVKR